MYNRELEQEVRAMAEAFSMVTILGPRQSGKTTLVRKIFSDKPYVNLEHLETRTAALSDPVSFIKQYEHGAIFDEIQRAPEILLYLQVLVDEQKKVGRFILTGSHQLRLQEAVSQSLAGRTAILKLLPLSLRELSQDLKKYSLDQQLLRGGYPRLYEIALAPNKYYSAYCQTYLERDVKLLINIKDLSLFQRFMRLCAGRVGCVFNASEIAKELGVSSHTVAEWVSVLEASFLIFKLPPYFENFGKRLIKSPKLYFTDVGLACYLLGIENEIQLERDPLRGRLVENLVILELVKTRYNVGLEPNLFFYRDQSQLEVDVLIQNGSELIPIEIKSSATFRLEFIKALEKFRMLTQRKISKSFLIYAGEITQPIREVSIIHYQASASVY
jgi:predicted AAA+ superfamily ATPase